MEFRILGPLDVLVEGSPLRLPGAKERALLTFLLLHANHAVPTDRLIDELWGDEPPETARKSLQVRVAGLRKALGKEVLVTHGRGYVLRVVPGALDLDRFERLLERAGESDAAGAADVLREALALWRGPALADFADEPFARAAAARLEELRLLAVEMRIDADLVLGHHAVLVGELQALVAEHPLRERLRAQLMLALYRAGRQAEALEVYRHTRRELVEQLGLEPGPELTALEQAILRQDPDLAPPRVPERSILVAARDESALDRLLAVAEPLARRPARELILARVVTGAAEVPQAAASVAARRRALLAQRVAARAAAFASAMPATDLLRLAAEQDADLVLIDGGPNLLDDDLILSVLAGSPCDVAVLVARDGYPADRPVLVPFAGAEHDWTAVELGAWIAGAQGVALRLAGPSEEGRDASLLLARASLAVQRALGVDVEPVLVVPGAEQLVQAAGDAGIVVLGLPERWRKDGLGQVRLAVMRESSVPTVVVRHGLRPGGLAPRESRTRFTWSLGSVSP